MPGGQYTNLKFQATSLGLGSEWDRICTSYAAANRALGDIVKVGGGRGIISGADGKETGSLLPMAPAHGPCPWPLLMAPAHGPCSWPLP